MVPLAGARSNGLTGAAPSVFSIDVPAPMRKTARCRLVAGTELELPVAEGAGAISRPFMHWSVFARGVTAQFQSER